MRQPLLAIAAAALLSGSVAAYAQQNSPPVDQTRDHRAQPADQMQTPTTRGTQRHDETRPEATTRSSSVPDTYRGRDHDLQNTQLQGDQNRDRTQDQNRDRMQDQSRDRLQGGEMIRGGEERGEGTHTLTVQERTNLRETVLREGPRVTHVNFRIGVGAVVPRTVRLVAVPQPIVAIYPEWSGDLFFTYGDEIVVVAPDSMAIVGVLPL